MIRLPCSARDSRSRLSAVHAGSAVHAVRASGLTLLLLALLAAPGWADDRALLAPYDGAWQRIADASAEAERLASIEAAIADLSWLVRKMASGVLTKTTVPPGEIAFTWDGTGLRQRVRGANGEFDRPIQLERGPSAHKDPRGEETIIEWRRTPDGLEVRWTQSQAFGRNIYRIDDRDETLHVEHRIQVTAIDGIDEIIYASRFGRPALPSVSSSAASAQTAADGARELR